MIFKIAKLLSARKAKNLFFIFLFIFNCNYRNETVRSELFIHKHDETYSVIPIIYDTVGRGTGHPALNCKKYDQTEADWLYIKKRSGMIQAADLILTHFEGKFDMKQQALEGFINITPEFIEIELEIPHFADGKNPSEWTKYRFNGRHRYRISNEATPYIKLSTWGAFP